MKNPIRIADRFVVDQFQKVSGAASARGIPAHKIALQFSILTAVMLIVGETVRFVGGYLGGVLSMEIPFILSSLICFIVTFAVSVLTVFKMYRMAVTVERDIPASGENNKDTVWESIRFMLAVWFIIILILMPEANSGSFLKDIGETTILTGDGCLIICFYLMDVIFRKPTKLKQTERKEAWS